MAKKIHLLSLCFPLCAWGAPITIESQFLSPGFSIEWGEVSKIEVEFTPQTAPDLPAFQSERPFFSRLGTYISSEVDLSVGWHRSSFGFGCEKENTCGGDVFYNIRYSLDKGGLGNVGVKYNFSNQTFEGYFSLEPLKNFYFGYQSGLANGLPALPPVKPLSINAIHTYGYGSWDFSKIGPIKVEKVDLALAEKYEPFTVGRYISDGVSAAREAFYTTDVNAASLGQRYAQRLRNTSAATASGNLNLRDAEYAFLGYLSGVAFRKEKFLDGFSDSELAEGGWQQEPWKWSPFVAAGYNVAKAMERVKCENAFARACAKISSFGAALLNKFGTPSNTSGLPGTTDFLGGVDSNSRAFLYGWAGGSIGSLGACLDSLSACALGQQSRAIQRKTQPVTEPILKTKTDGLDLSMYNTSDINEILVDVAAAELVGFTSVGGNFISLYISPEVDIVEEFYLFLANANGLIPLVVKAGVEYNFETLSELPVSVFSILDNRGKSADSRRFTVGINDAGVSLLQVSGLTSPVPEPQGPAMFAAGLLVLAISRLRRR